MLPPSRQLLAHTYLLAAGLTGAIIGYTVSRIEARFEISAITSSVQREPAPAVAVIDTKYDAVDNVSATLSIEDTIHVHDKAAAPVRAVSLQAAETAPPIAPSADLPFTPTDDLEFAARRLEERARTADRLGDPKLADLWKAEAARLRNVQAKRLQPALHAGHVEPETRSE